VSEQRLLVYVEEPNAGLKGWTLYHPVTVIVGIRLFKDIRKLKINIIG